MKPTKLNLQEIDLRMLELNTATDQSWQLQGDKLTATYKFSDFPQAFAFMTAVAIHAEKINHHPDWSNAYNKVSFSLSTHEIGGISNLDFVLAEEIRKLAEVFSCN
ncbi:MAG: 4a-hydroxytetrahydrobiopterin dehydratase [Chloroflexi bacterium 44-23]|nr:MAG: 4a-hydroxytetrahydrobiopterin dehydratase [Chloroflexi bacterium 44-23]